MINIIYICVFYVNIKVCVLYCIKKLNIIQIYSYHINIYFRLGLVGFRVEFDNIYTVLIIHRVQKIHSYVDRVGIHSFRIKFPPLPHCQDLNFDIEQFL
jgi:hypothetical protein